MRAAAPRDRRGERPGAVARSPWTRAARAPICSRRAAPALRSSLRRISSRRESSCTPTGARRRSRGRLRAADVDRRGRLRRRAPLRPPAGRRPAGARARTRRLRRHRQQDARAGPAARLAGRATAAASTPISSLRTAEDVHVPAPDQIALCHLLRSGAYERHVRRMRARYRARRDRLVAHARRARAGARARRDLSGPRGAAGAPRRRSDLRRAHRRGGAPLARRCTRWRRTTAPGARRATAS